MNRAPLSLGIRERLIFALDVPSRAQALEWIDRLGDTISFYKIGMELLASGEYFQVLDDLASRGKRVFVDLKFFDIPATVAGAIRSLSQWPISYCTIHGWHVAMMQAAAEANTGQMHLLAVTVLTSMARPDLAQMGIDREPVEVVIERALAAQMAGLDGVIASGQEAGPIRRAVGSGFSIVCPGIRPNHVANNDQQRTMGIRAAFANGADAIVVGRPIRLANDPPVAAEEIQAEIRAALVESPK
ncbi:orotidine-5'-phosphate decarboxylase [Xylella taiwanensis]|uniref:Orotidine 5'-phosphate decarboxylase n=1 Tax=Xylella taiwanensis TaxID=1444770 RepID=Z9JG50_9GAMM|nr:orotidine-5'-phosphate decarboxylase [Xylella taiwanensis]AXI82498.1 orotidine 5'-phosphate decarboxylase [Xylella taiwanensis]EWS77375.1 orotidine 5'-phosphate decarboxylase [Xylella taiwanensis]MCD8455490.1 orotidine-5'-phosphate decarboxylase [Xylella taiwanensis]MCD8457895.1 orotidine-5'-phosphate decarboxylase [Xylella taiwanensis]MCD8460030.1 orotidine-5'-phosphate decarboxylase [Xylella taiwanensis]